MTHRVVVASDIHWGAENKKAVQAFLKFVIDEKPALCVLAGDIVDLQALSKYAPEEDSRPSVTDEILQAVAAVNLITARGTPVYILSGNHEDRWQRAITGAKAVALRGTKGLSMEDQFRFQGMHSSVVWVEEGVSCPGLFIGKKALLIRHGHMQAGRYTSTKNIPERLLNSTPGISCLVGHHHKAQLLYRTVLGKTTVGIANPYLGAPQAYSPNANWQSGFTVLDFYGRSRLRDCESFSPQIAVMDKNCNFVIDGKVHTP